MSTLNRRMLKLGIKILNVLVVLSMLFTSAIGVPTAKAAVEQKTGTETEPVSADPSDYHAPAFTRPHPRYADQTDEVGENEASADDPIPANSNNTNQRVTEMADESNSLSLQLVGDQGILNSTNDKPALLDPGICVPPPAGLIDWWPAEGNANDIADGHNGTLGGGIAFVPGMIGQAFSFDGSDDSISLGTWFNLQDFTISMWVKTGTTQKASAAIVDNNHTSVNWGVQQNASATNQYSWGTTPFTLIGDQWQYLTISHDSSGNYRSYLDGVLIGSSNSGLITYTGTQSLRLGRWGGGGRNWKGLMDEVDVYDRALTDAEILSLFNAGNAGKCSTFFQQLSDPTQSTVEIPSTTIVANGVDAATILVTLKNRYGEPISGHTVSLAVSGTGNGIVGSPAQTAQDGTATFSLTTTKAETKTITITDQTQSLILNTKPTVRFVPGPVDLQKSSLTTNRSDALEDGIDAVTLTVTVLDALSNPISGANVTLSTTGNAVLIQPIGPTNDLGKATATITDAVNESVTVTATVNNVPLPGTVGIRFHCQVNGDLIVTSGDTCSLPAGAYTFGNISVQTGGTLIPLGNTSLNQGVTITATNVTIAAGGKISANGKGFQGVSGSSSGPGGGGTGVWTAGGGGYGGTGESSVEAGGATYGSMETPVTLGSSGGGGRYLMGSTPGGAGGGAIQLVVSGTLQVNGEIGADGISGGGRSGGGAGGSILIQTNEITGTGTIHANGGTGVDGAGEGAGGRIAIYYSNSGFTLDVANVNSRGGYLNGNGGGPGTVYFKNESTGLDKVLIDNGNKAVTTYASLVGGENEFNQIQITGNGSLRILGASSTLTIDEDTLVGDGTGWLGVEGTIHAPNTLNLEKMSVAVIGYLQGVENIQLQNAGNLELYGDAPLHVGNYSFSVITIGNGATLRLVTRGNGDADYTNDLPVQLNVENLSIAAGGSVSANATGYVLGQGTGRGQSSGRGGGHGGPGQIPGDGAWGGVYDSTTYPMLPGSPGYSYTCSVSNCYYPGGSGGGAIWLQVSDTLTVNGQVAADGGPDIGLGGGGSGGSILIEANTLAGAGTIHANGGSSSGGGKGGGGRIAIYPDTNTFTGTVAANGGPGYEVAGEGTIFRGILDLAQSTVQVSPEQLTADGIQSATVTVTLRNVDGLLLANKPVILAIVSGGGLNVNGQDFAPDLYVSIGSTDSSGVATAQVKTTQAGMRTLKARSGQESILQQPTVTFVPGPVSASLSTISVDHGQRPADGLTPATISVTALDAYGNPISGVDVVLSATGSAAVTQPAAGTNTLGKASGQITNTALETATVSATLDGVFLGVNKQVQLSFRGSDLAVTQSATASTSQGSSGDHATAGNPITYTLSLHNSGLMKASGVTLTDTLPAGFEFTSQNSTLDFTRSGQMLSWNVGDLAAGAGTTITLVAAISQNTLGSATNTLTATLDSVNTEENLANNTSQLVTTVEAQAAAVRFGSSSAVLQAQPGTSSAGLQVEVRNDGLGSSGTLGITLPAHLNDWVTVEPSSISSLAAGESATVTLTANPASSQPYGVSMGWLQATDGLGGQDNLALTVRVVPEQRNLVVSVSDEQGVVPGAGLQLQNNAAYTRVGVDGVSSTYHPGYSGTAGADGKINFSNLDEGSYTYQLSAAYHQERSGSLTIVAGTGAQTADLALTALPGLYIEPGSVTLVAAAGEQASQVIRVTNTGAAALEDMQVELSGLPDWVQLVLSDTLTRLDSQESAEFQVVANLPAGTQSQWLTGEARVSGTGAPQVTVSVSIDVLAAADARRDVRFELTDQDGNPVPGNAQVVVKRVRPGQMTIDGQVVPYQPQFSQQVGADGTALFQGDEQLEVGEEYSYQAWGDNYEVSQGSFTVTPQEVPAGVQSPASAGISLVSLQKTSERTQDQPQVQDVTLLPVGFVYSWNVTEIPGGIDLNYQIEVTITYPDGNIVTNAPSWCTTESGCDWHSGSGKASWRTSAGGGGSGGGGGGGGGPNLPPSVPTPPTRYSQMRLSQTVILAWQAFHASLQLTNTSALPLEQMTAKVKIADSNGIDRSADFVLLPPDAVEPSDTATLGSIAVNGEDSADWTIIPKGIGIASPTPFQVYAQIDYQLDGTAYSYNTVPEWIIVYPAPSLDIHYEAPYSEIPCDAFDIRATITNVGAGWAHELRYKSPKLLAGIGSVTFTLVSAKIGDVVQPDPMNLVLGYLPPDASRVVTWRISASKPVLLVDFSAELVDNNGIEKLIPAIHRMMASMVPSTCLMAAVPDEATYCPSCGATWGTQGNVGDPVNTRTGGFTFPMDDLSLPTSAGELSFRRTYVSLATDKYTIPLGFGWTHNQDVRLIFSGSSMNNSSAPSMNNYIGPHMVLFKDPSGNMYRFIDMGDGTYSAYLGVGASLVKNGTTPVTYTILDSAQTTYIFDASGLLQTQTDANGKAFDYSYNASGKLERVTAVGDNRYLQFDYDSAGNLESVADPTGRSVSFTYNSAGNLAASTDVLGNTWTYEYDSSHNLTRVVDPDGKTKVRNEYSSAGRVSKQFDGDGNLVVELIPLANGTVQIKNALDQIQVNAYNKLGTLTGEQDGAGNTTRKTYDGNFRTTLISDPAGNTTQLSWSADGDNLTSVTDAAGNQTSITYDGLNNPISVVDVNNYLTTYEYDGNLLTKSVDALNGETTYTYTEKGYLASSTDLTGRTTSYTYDTHGQRITMTDPSGQTWHYAYDDLGRLTDTTDPLGRVSHSEYDAAGKLLKSVRNYDPVRPQNDENLYNIVTTYEYDARGNQVAVTDTYNYTTRSEYDDAGRLVKTIDPAGHETANTYNAAGQLVASSDALGRTTHFEYDTAGRQIAVTDPLGNVTHTAYNPDGSVASTTDALGRVTTYEYDDLGRTVAVTDTLGNVTRTEYNEAGQVVATTDPRGNITHYEYDALGQLIRQTDPLGGVTEAYYNAAGQQVQTVDPLQHATTYTYDEAGRQVTVTDALGNVTRTEYDSLGRQAASVDAASHRTTYTYDALDRVIGTTDPLGHTATTAYDAAGNVLSRTDAAGNTVLDEYDSLNRLTSQTDPAGGVTSFTYDAAGNRLTVTDPNGNTTTTVYDAINRPISVVNPNGDTLTTAYDEAGNVTATTDALGNVTTFTSDALNRQVAVTDPLGKITQTQYDAAGNRIGVLDANGVTTHYEYDSLGRMSTVIENYRPGLLPTADINVRTEYTYDAVGNRKTLRDANDHVTTFAYDELDRQVSETDPLGNTWTAVYDSVGNRTSVTDANGSTTSYVYDSNHQLTRINYPDGTADVSFTYDSAGRRTAMTDGLGTTSWVYDDLNRPTAITDPFGKRVGYEYDADGNRTGLTYPDGRTVSYAYDPANRLTTVTDWSSQSTNYSYDPAGRLLDVLRPNGVDSAYSYDAAGRLLEIQHATATNTLSSFQYTYDNVGNRTQAVEHMVSGSGASSPTVKVTVVDSAGARLAGKSVYAFKGNSYSGYSKITDANGEVSITLPEGDYRFRADVDGTQFWSGDTDDCTIGVCSSALITVPLAVLVSVRDSDGAARPGLKVYAFSGSAYSNYSGTTDANGQISLRLPQGEYRFRADFNNTQFWSGAANHCSVPGCTIAEVTVTLPVTVSVHDTDGAPKSGLKVYAFNGSTYTNYSGTTDTQGQVSLTLPQGDYRFRADFNGTQFWSATVDNCSVPGCSMAEVTVTQPVIVNVQDNGGAPKFGVTVYAFNGTTYANYSGTTDDQGQVSLTLPQGDYRFRADFNGTQFWSGSANHCSVPGCTSTTVSVTNGTLVTIQDTDGAPKAGMKVYAFNGPTYTNYSGTTNVSGQVLFTLPQGSYHFRADINGTQFWSAASNHCDVPGCGSASVTVTRPLTVSVQDTDGTPKSGLKVYAFTNSTYTNYSGTSDANGQAVFTLPQGSYRFRADYNGAQYWSGSANHCMVSGCDSATVIVGPQFTPTPTYTTTPTLTPTFTPSPTSTSTPTHTLTPTPTESPTETLVPTATPTQTPTPTPTETSSPTLSPSLADTPTETATPTPTGTSEDTPMGMNILLGGVSLVNYQLASIQGSNAGALVPNSAFTVLHSAFKIQPSTLVLVTVQDTDGGPKSGLKVYAFDAGTYAGVSSTTDENGQAAMNLPDGNYRFRADLNGTQFWSGTENHCAVPACEAATVTVTIPLTVTVQDTDNSPKSGLKVYAFTGSKYANYSSTTDANGQANFTLPQGDYRFRADLNGTQFWSGVSNHCSLPGCDEASVTVTKPVTVTVANRAAQAYPGLNVYAFDGTRYTGYHGVTDEAGHVNLTLPQGSYRFRADYDGVQFWSSSENACTLPGCTSAAVTLPGGLVETDVTIDYTYDPLYRLTAADYSDGKFYHYSYDSVGNRLTQATSLDESTYSYDEANRIRNVGGVDYTWDANGNILNDGENTYAYDSANRLISVSSEQGIISSYAYNGSGDRVQQNVDGATITYTLDLNAGLTQVLSDGTNTYLYGSSRIAQENMVAEYFLGDALGSVRQLTDAIGGVTLAKNYDPFGDSGSSLGSSATPYGFTGEQQDSSTGMVYLRARYYSSSAGRFLTRDSWQGDYNRPLSLNRWGFVEGNPINREDPTGHYPLEYFTNAINNTWSYDDENIVKQQVDYVADIYARVINNAVLPRIRNDCNGIPIYVYLNLFRVTPTKAFYMIHGSYITFEKSDTFYPGVMGFTHSPRYITFYRTRYRDDPETVIRDHYFNDYPNVITHELGHAYNDAVQEHTGVKAEVLIPGDLLRPYYYDEHGNLKGRRHCDTAEDDDGDGYQACYGYWADYKWQFGQGGTEEEFADMFVGWVYNKSGAVDPLPNGSPSPFAKRGNTMREIMFTTLGQIVKKHYNNNFYFK